MPREHSLYSLHPGYAMEKTFERNLLERTGRTLEEWVDLVRKTGPTTEAERRAWLKREHGISTNYAWWIAGRTDGDLGAEGYDPEGLVDAMYSGARFGLRPLYDRLLEIGLGIAPDVKACPGKTIVPLYRNHVFAQLKPSTRTRLDLGLALRDAPAEGRLIDTGGFAKKDRITHRIAITAPEDIDEYVIFWMRTAYALDA